MTPPLAARVGPDGKPVPRDRRRKIQNTLAPEAAAYVSRRAWALVDKLRDGWQLRCRASGNWVFWFLERPGPAGVGTQWEPLHKALAAHLVRRRVVELARRTPGGTDVYRLTETWSA